jgi:hypothetical protein
VDDATRPKGSHVLTLLLGLLIGLVGGYLIATRRQLITTLRRQRASRTELDSLSRAELYKRAQAEDLPGRSNMTKEELHDALTTDTRATGGELVDSITGRNDP